MTTDRIINLARRHLGGTMESSAQLCLSDALALREAGNLFAASQRALKSLAYSVGVGHRDYARAACGIANAAAGRWDLGSKASPNTSP